MHTQMFISTDRPLPMRYLLNAIITPVASTQVLNLFSPEVQRTGIIIGVEECTRQRVMFCIIVLRGRVGWRGLGSTHNAG